MSRPRAYIDAAVGACARLLSLMRAPFHDVIIVSKYVSPILGGPFARALMIAARGRPIILDVDDDVFYRSDSRMLARRATAVVAGSSYLFQMATQLGATRAMTIPSVVDTTNVQGPVPSNPLHGRLIVGWLGTERSYRVHLKMILDKIVRVCAQYDAHVKVVGPPGIQGEVTSAGAEFVVWDLEGEPEQIATFTVGLMPLDEAVGHGKCGYKAVQYSAQGVPSVASDVGAARSVIRHGVTGYVARDEDEFLNAVGWLLRHPRERLTMGEAARKHVHEGFSVSDAAARWIQLLQQLTASDRGEYVSSTDCNEE